MLYTRNCRPLALLAKMFVSETNSTGCEKQHMVHSPLLKFGALHGIAGLGRKPQRASGRKPDVCLTCVLCRRLVTPPFITISASVVGGLPDVYFSPEQTGRRGRSPPSRCAESVAPRKSRASHGFGLRRSPRP